MTHRILTTTLVAAAALGLGACDSYGDGYGYRGSYASSYGYGYGDGYYGGNGYYDRGSYYGSSYSPSYYGWYNDYYYPGTGYYVYSRSGDRYRWNDSTRRYWEGRRDHYRDDRRGHDGWRDNWSGYHRDDRGRYYDPRDRGRDHDYDRDRHRDRRGR